MCPRQLEKKLSAARRSRWRQLLYGGNGSIFNIPSVNDDDFLLSTLLMFVKLWLHSLWVPCQMGLIVFKILSYCNFFYFTGWVYKLTYCNFCIHTCTKPVNSKCTVWISSPSYIFLSVKFSLCQLRHVLNLLMFSRL